MTKRQPPPPPAHQILMDLRTLDGADRIQLAGALRRVANLHTVRPAVAAILQRAAQHTTQSLDHLDEAP
jgi:hypothetical protein